MATTTREGLKQYALRALGAPVLEINIDEDQLEDRLDEAIEYWRIYHPEGIEKVYLKHQIKATVMHITTNNGDDFNTGDRITGADSEAVAIITSQTDGVRSEGNQLIVKTLEGEFLEGENVSTGTVTATLAEASTSVPEVIILGEIDKQYCEVNDLIYGINRVLPFSGTQTSRSLFDIQYQLRLNDLYDLTSTSIVYYKMTMAHLALLDLELNGKPQMRFNRLTNRLYIDMDWANTVPAGDYIVVDCYRALDPATYPRLYNEAWLKHYTTALFKKAWATNLKKFQGIQLPGGVILDGVSLYQEAMAEIKELEEELILKAAPLEFYLG